MSDKNTVTFFIGENIYTVPLEDTSIDAVELGQEVSVCNSKSRNSEAYIMTRFCMKAILRDVLDSEVNKLEAEAKLNRDDITMRRARKETYKVGSFTLEEAVFNKVEHLYPKSIQGKKGYEEVHLFFDSQVFS